MEKPTLEVVIQYLDALYRGEDNTAKEQASLWLMQLHSSVHAWSIADQLLLLKRDMETSYFAAQTMQNKIRFSFAELPEDTHIALRDSLMNHLQNLSDAPATITRQLAMALADLALQMSNWNTVVADLIQRFSSDLSTISVLLDILIVLPEEINNRSLHLGHNRRKELRENLGKSSTDVLSLLAACLSQCSSDPGILTRVYACMGSWVQLGNFPGEDLARSSLISSPFQTLQLLEIPQKLYEAATDCICSTLFMCEDTPNYYTLAQILQVQVKGLFPVFQASVLTEDSNRAYSLCRIFTEMAESFLYYMVHHPNSELGSLHMLDMLLECVAHPDYEIAGITFNVWYRLSEELLKANDDHLSEIFKPYIEKLISHLCVHCQLDEDTGQTTVLPDDSDDFTSFRNNVVELVRDVIFLVGSLHSFSSLYSNICKPGVPWYELESSLFIMHSVAPAIRLDESEVLPIAVPVLLSISPDTHYAIRATTLKLVAELAEWIDKHPDTLDLVLRFILDGLRIPAVASYAAKAVQNVCLRCKKRMAPHIEGLLQIIEAADTLSISNEAIIGLLKGATEVLTKMPHDVITNGVRRLCSFQAGPLQQLCQSSSTVAESGTSSDPCVWVDRLTAVFRSCVLEVKAEELHPCVSVLEELWPVLSLLCNKYIHDQKVIERTCRCIRFILRSLSKSAAGILSPLVTMCVSIYRQHQHSCFLYLGSIVVDEFGSDVAYQQGLIGMLQAFAEVAFPLLAAAPGLVNNPDTVDDMFRMCARFLQRCPLVFLSSVVSATVSQCALAAATLNHRDAFSSVMRYFRDLLQLPQGDSLTESDRQMRSSAVESFLNQNGPVLMDALVTGFVNLPTFMISDSCEVLWELLVCARDPMCQLLRISVDKIPISGSVKVTADQKLWFVESVAKCAVLEDLFPVVKDLARLYR